MRLAEDYWKVPTETAMMDQAGNGVMSAVHATTQGH